MLIPCKSDKHSTARSRELALMTISDRRTDKRPESVIPPPRDGGSISKNVEYCAEVLSKNEIMKWKPVTFNTEEMTK